MLLSVLMYKIIGITMCKFCNWADDCIKKFRWFHISLIKIATFAFALMIAKLFPAILGLDWYMYLVIAILASVPPMLVMMKKDDGNS